MISSMIPRTHRYHTAVDDLPIDIGEKCGNVSLSGLTGHEKYGLCPHFYYDDRECPLRRFHPIDRIPMVGEMAA